MPPRFNIKIVIYCYFRATTSVMPSLRPKVPCQIPLMTSGEWCGRASVLPLSCSPWRKKGEGYVALHDSRLMQAMNPFLLPHCRSSVTSRQTSVCTMKHLRYLIDWTNPKISTLFSASIRFSCVCMVTNVPVRPTPALQRNCHGYVSL